MSNLHTNDYEHIKQIVISGVEFCQEWYQVEYYRDGCVYEWQKLHYTNDPYNYDKPLHIVVALYFDIHTDTFGLVFRKELSELDEEECSVFDDIKVRGHQNMPLESAIIHGARLHRELEKQIALEKLAKQARVSLADEEFFLAAHS